MKFLRLAIFLFLALFVRVNLAQTPTDTAPVMQGTASYAMPQSAIDAKIGGSILVAIRVDETGKPTNVAILSGLIWPCGSTPTEAFEELSSTLTETMMKLQFTPGTENGKPVTKDIGLRLELRNPQVNSKPVDIDPATGKRRETSISGGVLNGKATNLPKPDYPAAAKADGESGVVTVQILIDENGKVIRAGGVSGPPRLQIAAREAACEAKFSPTTLQGAPIKVSGVLTYRFIP